MVQACSISCMFSAMLIIAMIIMTSSISSSQTIKNYQNQLPPHLKKTYNEIKDERTRIFYFGYALGFILALIIILYNTQIRKNKMEWRTMVCVTISVSFITNYFYYILTPKTKWMLEELENKEQTKAWLQMYKNMQMYYHGGLVFGIAAIGLMAFAFRC
jgi:MFS family permease